MSYSPRLNILLYVLYLCTHFIMPCVCAAVEMRAVYGMGLNSMSQIWTGLENYWHCTSW